MRNTKAAARRENRISLGKLCTGGGGTNMYGTDRRTRNQIRYSYLICKNSPHSVTLNCQSCILAHGAGQLTNHTYYRYGKAMRLATDINRPYPQWSELRTKSCGYCHRTILDQAEVRYIYCDWS